MTYDELVEHVAQTRRELHQALAALASPYGAPGQQATQAVDALDDYLDAADMLRRAEHQALLVPQAPEPDGLLVRTHGQADVYLTDPRPEAGR